VPRMRSLLVQSRDPNWTMEGLSLRVEDPGPQATLSTRLKEGYRRLQYLKPAKVIASIQDLNTNNEKLSPEWHPTLLTPTANQQSVPALADGNVHNDQSGSFDSLKFLTPLQIEEGPESATAPSSHPVPGSQPSVGTAECDGSNSPAAQQGSALSVNAVPSPSETRSSSSLPHHTTIRIDAKHYISMDLPMPPHYTSQWEGRIKKQLETSIASSLAIRDDTEAALMLEAYMAGRTKGVLKPSIWITCCSSRMKKKLKSHLKTLQWLKDSGFQYFVRVDKTFGYRTDDSTNLDDQTLIEARLPPVPETFCGIPTRVNSIPGRGSVKPHIEFTIGGLICMDDDFACLTAGHPFLPLTREDKSGTESSGSEDEGSDYSISGFHSETETDNTEDGCTGQKPGSPPDSPGLSARSNKSLEMQKDPTPFQTLRHKGVLSHFGPYAQPRPEQPASKDNGNDWAVLLMGLSPSSLLPNKFQVPGDEDPTFVDQIVSTPELVKGPVWVAAGSGVRKGVLNPNPASIFLRGSFRNVRQIMLDESLSEFKSFTVC